jgi:hypothetical protein
MLEWIAIRPRERAEILEVWRTSCPRLSIWEDACIDGLIDYEAGTGKVILSEAGKAFLKPAALGVTRTSEAASRVAANN